MKEKGISFYIGCFLGLTAAAYLEYCTVYAFVWAGFSGFGGIWLEYTEKGEAILSAIVCVPPALLLLMLLFRMVIHFKRKEAVQYYFYDILFCVMAIAAGVFLFYFLEGLSHTIMDVIVYFVRESDLMKVPVP